MTYFERIVNVETGETTERQYTAEEIAEVEAKQEEAKALAAAEAQKVAAKQALLDKLGITAEEAQLLFS